MAASEAAPGNDLTATDDLSPDEMYIMLQTDMANIKTYQTTLKNEINDIRLQFANLIENCGLQPIPTPNIMDTMDTTTEINNFKSASTSTLTCAGMSMAHLSQLSELSQNLSHLSSLVGSGPDVLSSTAISHEIPLPEIELSSVPLSEATLISSVISSPRTPVPRGNRSYEDYLIQMMMEIPSSCLEDSEDISESPKDGSGDSPVINVDANHNYTPQILSAPHQSLADSHKEVTLKSMNSFSETPPSSAKVLNTDTCSSCDSHVLLPHQLYNTACSSSIPSSYNILSSLSPPLSAPANSLQSYNIQSPEPDTERVPPLGAHNILPTVNKVSNLLSSSQGSSSSPGTSSTDHYPRSTDSSGSNPLPLQPSRFNILEENDMDREIMSRIEFYCDFTIDRQRKIDQMKDVLNITSSPENDHVMKNSDEDLFTRHVEGSDTNDRFQKRCNRGLFSCKSDSSSGASTLQRTIMTPKDSNSTSGIVVSTNKKTYSKPAIEASSQQRPRNNSPTGSIYTWSIPESSDDAPLEKSYLRNLKSHSSQKRRIMHSATRRSIARNIKENNIPNNVKDSLSSSDSFRDDGYKSQTMHRQMRKRLSFKIENTSPFKSRRASLADIKNTCLSPNCQNNLNLPRSEHLLSRADIPENSVSPPPDERLDCSGKSTGSPENIFAMVTAPKHDISAPQVSAIMSDSAGTDTALLDSILTDSPKSVSSSGIFAPCNSRTSPTTGTDNSAGSRSKFTSTRISDNQLTSTRISDNKMTSTRIGDNKMTSTRICENLLTSTRISDNNQNNNNNINQLKLHHNRHSNHHQSNSHQSSSHQSSSHHSSSHHSSNHHSNKHHSSNHHSSNHYSSNHHRNHRRKSSYHHCDPCPPLDIQGISVIHPNMTALSGISVILPPTSSAKRSAKEASSLFKVPKGVPLKRRSKYQGERCSTPELRTSTPVPDIPCSHSDSISRRKLFSSRSSMLSSGCSKSSQSKMSHVANKKTLIRRFRKFSENFYKVKAGKLQIETLANL